MSKFVLDLRKAPPPPPLETDADRCKALKQEMEDLKHTQKALLGQIALLNKQLESRHNEELQQTKTELEQSKKLVTKLTTEHQSALKLIVTMSSQISERKTTPKRNRIEEYYKALERPQI